MKNFIYVLDKVIAEKYKTDNNFSFLHETILNDQKAWVFSSQDKKLNFENVDKTKVIFTNKLMF